MREKDEQVLLGKKSTLSNVLMSTGTNIYPGKCFQDNKSKRMVSMLRFIVSTKTYLEHLLAKPVEAVLVLIYQTKPHCWALMWLTLPDAPLITPRGPQFLLVLRDVKMNGNLALDQFWNSPDTGISL